MMNSNNIVQRRHNSFTMDGRTGWMNMSYSYSWFGMNLQTPPLQLWNKEEEDECIKQRVRWKDQQSGKIKEAKRWHDKRMRKKRCDLGNKKLMNSSRCEASRTRENFKQKGRTIMSHLSFVIWCLHALMTKVTSKDKWSLFKKLFLILVGTQIRNKHVWVTTPLLDLTWLTQHVKLVPSTIFLSS